MENIEETFLEILSPYISDSILKFQEQEKSYEFGFDIKNYNDSLHVLFQYYKAGKIGIKEVHIFQNFLAKVNIEASKSRLNYTTLLDTNALFFSKKLLPYLHSYEWALRKLIYLLVPTYFSDNWAEESIPNEIIASIKRKQIQATGKFDSKNLLQWIDLYDFEEYLFGENYILVTQENEENIVRYKEISQDQLLKLFQDNSHTISDSYSLWSEVFSKYMDVRLEEIQSDMSLIREGRNIVSHNKEIEMALYQELIKKLKRYTNQLEKAFQKILAGDIASEDLSDMSDDFEGYIGNYFSNIDTGNLTTLSESTKSTLKELQATMVSQQGVLKGITVPTATISALKELQATMSSQQGVLKGITVPNATISALKELQATMSSQQGVLKGITVPTATISALKELQATMSSQQGVLKGITVPTATISALKELQATMSSQQGILKGITMSTATISALKELQATMSSQQGILKGITMPTATSSALKGLQDVLAVQSSLPQGIMSSGLDIEHQVKENETIDTEEDESNK
jgi:hypothetical protein